MENCRQQIDQKIVEESQRLSEAIMIRDLPDIETKIKFLIKKRAIVNIVAYDRKFYCDSHNYFFSDENPSFSRIVLYWATHCNYQHKYCLKCIKAYLQDTFTTYYFNNCYPCLACSFYNEENTLLLTDNDLEYLAYDIFGEEWINNVAIAFNQSEIVIPDKMNNCSICNQSVAKLTSICLIGHQLCQQCIIQWTRKLSNTGLKCFYNGCNGTISLRIIIDALSKDRYLKNISHFFSPYGINLDFCTKCQLKIDLNYSKSFTSCSCGEKICNNCKRKGHYGLTCFYYESSKEFEVIDLAPPANIDKINNLREQEYLNAKYAFENFVYNKNLKVNKVRLIVNKPLERRYSAKKNKMATECGGEDKVDEVYIWHGSRYANYDVIMKDGLKVGGVDAGVPIAQGAAHGYGIYSDITPNTPIGYARDSQWLLACLAMRGKQSSTPLTNVSQIDNGRLHSYMPPGSTWHIFFTKEQVLPRFLIEYK